MSTIAELHQAFETAICAVHEAHAALVLACAQDPHDKDGDGPTADAGFALVKIDCLLNLIGYERGDLTAAVGEHENRLEPMAVSR